MIEIFLLTTTVLLVGVLFGVSIFRRPFTNTKATFLVFGVFLITWNLLELVYYFFPSVRLGFHLEAALSCLTLYALVLFSLHFPYFNRRSNKLTYFSIFLGGVGFSILSHIFSIPIVGKNFPNEINFFIQLNHFLSRVFAFLCFLSVILITSYKLTRSIHRLKIAFFKSLILFFLFSIGFISFLLFLGDEVNLFTASVELLFLDSFFIIAFILAFSQFQFVDFYPGIFSIFFHGEIPRLVIQKSAPASGKGAAYLKEELWKIYEVENWGNFLSEFWFSIIIDETIDNALEHGGKRHEDEIIIQVFETKKFLDFYVMDMGKGFDPNSIPDPSLPDRKLIPTGRGIYILKKLFPVAWNFLGNEIRVRVSKDPKQNPSEI